MQPCPTFSTSDNAPRTRPDGFGRGDPSANDSPGAAGSSTPTTNASELVDFGVRREVGETREPSNGAFIKKSTVPGNGAACNHRRLFRPLV